MKLAKETDRQYGKKVQDYGNVMKLAKETDRQYGKKVQDYRNVMKLAASKGVDVNNFGQYPATDSYNDRLSTAFKGAYSKDLADKVNSLNKAYAPPKPEDNPKIDVKHQMGLERQKRKGRWADALYAFGEGLQGRTANKDDFYQNRIQRQQDKEFQDYKDTTDRNNKAKYAYETLNTDKMINWLDQQYKDKRNSDLHREQFEETKKYHEGLLAARKASGSKTGKVDKANQPVRIKTYKKTYELKPEEVEFYAREAKKNGELIGERFPEFWIKNQKTDKRGEPIGKASYSLKPNVSNRDLAAAYLEEQENPSFSEFNKHKDNLQEIYKSRGDIEPEAKQQPKQKAEIASPLDF